MIKSKFHLWAFLPPTMTILVTGLLYLIFSVVIVSSINNLPTAVYVFSGIFLFTWTWLVFGELRTKIITVSIDKSSITRRSYLGLGSKRQFDFKEFDGFTTSLGRSRWGTYEYLFLQKDNKKVIKLSEFYHKNYFELKQDLKNKVKYMGDKPTSTLTDLKEIFQ